MPAAEGARAQHTAHLMQGAFNVGDGAQGPGDQHMVDAGGAQRQCLAVEAGVLDRYRAGRYPLGGQLPPCGGRVDRLDTFHFWRVVGHVEARAESDLEYLPLEPRGDAGAHAGEFATAKDDVGQAGENLLLV